jgi:competence protein ComEC
VAIAHGVAGARGAVATLAQMPGWAFALMVVGGLWLCLWTTRPRLLGLVPAAIGAAGAWTSPTPDLLITGDGKHLALIDDGIPRLLRDGAGDYVRDIMAEASGFDGDPTDLASRAFTHCSRDACVAEVNRGGRRWRILATRSAQRIDWQELTEACAAADIAVSDRWLPQGCTPQWLKLDRKTLAETGGIAVFFEPAPRTETIAQRLGRHPWTM